MSPRAFSHLLFFAAAASLSGAVALVVILVLGTQGVCG